MGDYIVPIEKMGEKPTGKLYVWHPSDSIPSNRLRELHRDFQTWPWYKMLQWWVRDSWDEIMLLEEDSAGQFKIIFLKKKADWWRF